VNELNELIKYDTKRNKQSPKIVPKWETTRSHQALVQIESWSQRNLSVPWHRYGEYSAIKSIPNF